MRRLSWVLGTIVGVGCLSALVYAQAAKSLIINGKVASTDVRVINGRSYAPVADLAKALDLTVAQRPDGSVELTRAGGSGAIEAKVTGKMNDWLFDGGWRVRITGIGRTQKYECANEWYSTTSYEAEEGKEIIAVTYELRNGNKKVGGFVFGDTALAGTQGDAEPVHGNDFKFDGSMYASKPMLPGAEMKGTLIFMVNKGFEVKDLIITASGLSHYDDAVRPKEESVYRISLK